MKRLFYIPLFLWMISLSSQTIEEKKEQAGKSENGSHVLEMDRILQQVNHKISDLRQEMHRQTDKANHLLEEGAKTEEYHQLLVSIQAIKQELKEVQEKWRRTAVSESKKDEDGYSLWDQEDITLSALVMEYGSGDFLYIIPPDLAPLKIALHSNIPIPRESWSDLLEIILSQNGIGVKELNPYTRQLYLLKLSTTAVSAITSSLEDVRHLSDSQRILFVFSPPIEQAKSSLLFFEKFADQKTTLVHTVANKVVLVANKGEVEKLMQLYHTVWKDPEGKISKVVSVTKMSVKEMEKILYSFFKEAVEIPNRPIIGRNDSDGLSIISPSQGNALVLMGRRETVERAEKVVRDTENQLQDPAEMTVFMYNCKHSDPNDLAKVLDKVYYSLFHAVAENRENVDVNYSARGNAVALPPDGYAQAPGLTVPPQRFKPEIDTKLEVEQNSDHFIPDPKTGNLLMVVRRDVLFRIKDLLRYLDVPKKMVQIEVLLFEKKINNQSNYGLNLLKLGGHNGVRYDGPHVPPSNGLKSPVGRGVLEFLFSGKKSKYFPAYDFAYSFLMTQDDIQLNAAPSVITVNQTPATISILEELSLNNGAAPIDSNRGPIFEKSFTRAQYGITIILTPIIHLPDNEDEDEDERGFVTLQTNISFDTTRPSHDDRPHVDRRHIENEVRVYDGQTVILGGLRRKSLRDSEQKVPFLGELPGIGKLFGSTELQDHNTEMFFFITPKIITDPKEQLLQIRCSELCKRPGDIPEFLQRVVEARECEKRRLFSNSIKVFFGDKQQYYES